MQANGYAVSLRTIGQPMTKARLSIALPEETWICSVSTAHPETTITVLAAMPTEDAGVGLVELDGAIEGVLDAMEAADGVMTLDILQATEETALVRFDTSEPMLLVSAQEAGVPFEWPVHIRDGQATLDVTAPHERLSALGRALDGFGMDYRLEHVYESFDPDDLLTDRQRHVLAVAINRGYYDTPRTCTLTDLAAELDVAKSTAGEMLHRTEGKVLKRVIGSPTESSVIDNKRK